MLLGLVQRVHHQLHDGLVDAKAAHQVWVLEEHLVVCQVPAQVNTTQVRRRDDGDQPEVKVKLSSYRAASSV